MNRSLVLALVLLLGTTIARADADPPQPPAAPITSPSQVEQHFREVLTRPQFQDTDEPDINSDFREWLSDWFKHFGFKFGEFKYARHLPAFESALMSVLVMLSLGGLIYTMARLTYRYRRPVIKPLTDNPGPRMFRPPEFYEAEIQAAIQSRDWHAAWLASWRQFLSRLENRQLVEADRTRTNREYLSQLRTQSLPSSALVLLTGMVDTYDRFIYGRRTIGEPDWNLFHRQIHEAGLLLHLDEKAATPQTGEGLA